MKKKLTLKKERIKELSAPQMSNVAGGKTAKSSNNGFTCCWCLGDVIVNPDEPASASGGCTSEPSRCYC